MKFDIELGEDPRETLTNLHRAYRAVEQLSHSNGASHRDIHHILTVLNACLESTIPRVPHAHTHLALVGQVG